MPKTRETVKKRFFLTALLIVCFFLYPAALFAQEALESFEEEYYDFLSLQGLTKRPALNYRTLSDSAWNIAADNENGETPPHPWQNLNLGTKRRLFGEAAFRVYGPELFMSGNTAAPYGQNDGALWQGRGFNASFTGGVRFEGYGVELAFKPRLSFSQNAAFEYITPNYSGAIFAGKAETYGYYGIQGIDAPQRFGDEPFFAWDWGDSEARYTWKTLTVGFGTQAIWLGPAQINPIIHSNNAPSYPKLDFGLRRQRITLPWLGWHIGDIEARTWWGYLSESAWFDNDTSNDHNLITGFSIAYGFPGVLRGLTIGLNRIMLSKWDDMNAGAIFTLLWPFNDTAAGYDKNDQRLSVTINYLLPLAGINIYIEWARNDHSWTDEFTIRYPFHTQAYTVGIEKSILINSQLQLGILLEVSNLENSTDYIKLFSWGAPFYGHHVITQGHTNNGQYIGAGIGSGGNSQYLGIKLYYPKGFGQIFLQRRNPDLDYTWFIDSSKYPEAQSRGYYIAEWNIRAFIDIGISGLYYITPSFSASASFVFRDEHNPLNQSKNHSIDGDVDPSSVHRYNFYIMAGLKYSF